MWGFLGGASLTNDEFGLSVWLCDFTLLCLKRDFPCNLILFLFLLKDAKGHVWARNTEVHYLKQRVATPVRHGTLKHHISIRTVRKNVLMLD